MIEREPRIRLVLGYAPHRAEVRGKRMLSATFRQPLGEKVFTAAGGAFADCSYEGDLLAAAGLPYRVGRDARSEFGEPHVGIIFTKQEPWGRKSPYEGMSLLQFRVNNALNLSTYGTRNRVVETPDRGRADPAVQAYNMRMVLTRDPANRIAPAKPEGYDPGWIKSLLASFASTATNAVNKGPPMHVPNSKAGWNQPELVGEQTAYVEGGWPARMEIIKKHANASLGALYYFQNDPAVPQEQREHWRQWGLPRDEFTDNGHVPWEVYVREARRLTGQFTFTEHDASLAPGLERAPVHADSVSVTEWFMDSHACTPRRIGGSHQEGDLMLKNLTFPGQVPCRTLYSDQIGNLLVPVCLSASHIGWGTIRLEPTWMSVAEAAAFAVSWRGGAASRPPKWIPISWSGAWPGRGCFSPSSTTSRGARKSRGLRPSNISGPRGSSPVRLRGASGRAAQRGGGGRLDPRCAGTAERRRPASGGPGQGGARGGIARRQGGFERRIPQNAWRRRSRRRCRDHHAGRGGPADLREIPLTPPISSC